jgi:hypothetical protein
MYSGRIYEVVAAIEDWVLTGSQRQMIPNPKFFCLYNGKDDAPDKTTVHLKDSFILEEGDEPMLDLAVDVYNISLGHNKAMLEACEPLRGYSFIVHEIKELTKTLPAAEAIEKAINSCIQNGILVDYLKKYRLEVPKMLALQLDLDQMKERLDLVTDKFVQVNEKLEKIEKDPLSFLLEKGITVQDCIDFLSKSQK